MGRGRVCPARGRGLLVAGALLPFALGATLALATGRVTPLQATRLLAGLPFVAILMAVGLASLRGRRAWAAGAAALGALLSFLTLALARPGYEASPTQALAREVGALPLGRDRRRRSNGRSTCWRWRRGTCPARSSCGP